MNYFEPRYSRRPIPPSASTPPRGAGPEVSDLHEAMGEMATRLNAQFEREAEFGRVLSGAAKALQPLYERKGLSFTLELPAGIAAEDREAILSGHRTEEGRLAAPGFGVGLMLVKKILDAHATALEIEGESGRGSRFSFVLPRWDGPEEKLSA